MKLLESKTVDLGDASFTTRGGNRAIILYEELAGKLEVESFEDSIKWFYCTAKAGAIHKKEPFEMTFEEFLDVIDGHPDAMPKFSEAMGGKSKKKVVGNLLILVIYTAIVLGAWELIRYILWII